MTKLPRTPAFDLAVKKVLVTGASSGIGFGCAMAVAEAGAETYCAARGVDRLNEAVAARHAGQTPSAFQQPQVKID